MVLIILTYNNRKKNASKTTIKSVTLAIHDITTMTNKVMIIHLHFNSIVPTSLLIIVLLVSTSSIAAGLFH